MRRLIAFSLLMIAVPASADPVVEAARAAGQVGEQADGFLGIRSGGSPDLKARVDQINIKRRAIFTDTAARKGVTIGDVAAATGCEQLKNRVQSGQYYRDAGGNWTQKGAGAIALPAYCG